MADVPAAPAPAVVTAPAHPWRRVLRTAFAWVTGVAPMLPLIINASDLTEATPGVSGALAISAGITRVLALPAVETFLRRYVPWLAAGDVASEAVVAAVTADGTVVAGEAHRAVTGSELTGSIADAATAPRTTGPRRSRRAKKTKPIA